MKANELRFGNLVSDGMFRVKVVNITECLIAGSTCDRLEQVYSFNLENIEPIKLTEEWLLKFGFKSKRWGTVFYMTNFPRTEITKMDAGLVLTIQGSGKILPNPILFVHQLQNLYFALTNEELTIEQP